MFCGKCGVKNADDAAFCTGCGAKLNGGESTKKVDSGDRNRKIGMIAVAVIAVVLVALIVGLFGGRGYKATVNKFVDAEFTADAKGIVELIPKRVVNYVLEEEGYDDDELDEFIEEGEKELQKQLNSIQKTLGDDWKVSCEILEADDVKGDDLDDLKDEYEDMDVKVSAAKTVMVELTIKAGEVETSTSMNISVIKVGRSWYLDMVTMGGLF